MIERLVDNDHANHGSSLPSSRSSAPAPPGRGRKTSVSPQAIAEAALQEFRENGYGETRMATIATRAGVGKGTLYLHFTDKEALFRAAVEQALTPLLARMNAAAGDTRIGVEERLRQVLRLQIRTMQDERLGALARLIIGESRRFPELARFWGERVVLPALAVVSGVIQEGMAANVFAPADPHLAARLCVAPMLLSLLWGEVFAPAGLPPLDTEALMVRHLHWIHCGLVRSADAATPAVTPLFSEKTPADKGASA
mgnify:CR=1 FL=1